jgi:hypothetical protein
MARTKKEPSPRSQCWCKEMEFYPHPKHPTPRKRKPTEFDALIGDLESLRDGRSDELGRLLGRAIAALRRKQEQGPLIVVTMESESKSWLAVGRTEEEARAGLRKRWDEIVVPLGGETWDRSNRGGAGDAGDYYGLRVQHVVLGKGYCDGEDEKGV